MGRSRREKSGLLRPAYWNLLLAIRGFLERGALSVSRFLSVTLTNAKTAAKSMQKLLEDGKKIQE